MGNAKQGNYLKQGKATKKCSAGAVNKLKAERPRAQGALSGAPYPRKMEPIDAIKFGYDVSVRKPARADSGSRGKKTQ